MRSQRMFLICWRPHLPGRFAGGAAERGQDDADPRTENLA